MRPRPFTSAYVIVGIIVAVLFVMSIFDPPYRNLFAPSNWWEYLGFLSIMVSVIVLGVLSDRELVVPENPLRLLAVTRTLAEEPGWIVSPEELAESEKSTTLMRMLAEWDHVPLVPVTVSV